MYPSSNDVLFSVPACLNINGVLQCYVSEKTCLERYTLLDIFKRIIYENT